MDSPHPAVIARVLALRQDPADADRMLDDWIRRFVAVADRGLRRTVLADCMHGTDDGSLLGLLVRIDARAARGDTACRWMATELALTPSVLAELPYARCAELHGAARAAGLDDLAARFLGLHARAPAPTAKRRAASIENPHLDASAGERTAAARRSDRLVLDRLLHDRDPRVIAALLDNPRVTESDVVRIAAMRPTVPAIPSRIAEHPRWAQRYRVRKALAFNPSTPAAVALPLLPTLLRQDVQALLDSRALPEALRRAARTLVEPRAHEPVIDVGEASDRTVPEE